MYVTVHCGFRFLHTNIGNNKAEHMFATEVTAEIQQAVRAAVEESPSIMLGELARTLDIPEGTVAQALPEAMRTFVPTACFDEIWENMTGWEKVIFIAQSPGAIVEVKGKLPAGRYGHGFFNLMEKDNPLGGHLRVDALGAICFLEKPFFGLESLSVQFYSTEGEQMFSVYAGREKRELIPSVKERYKALRGIMAGRECA